MKTAVVYARYSSDKQTEQSIEGQLRVCNEYAKRNDIVIAHTYIDRAMTGTNDNRPDFKRMLKDSKKGNWDYVLVYKLDRFSRDKYETAIHKHDLKKYGVKVISAMENIPDTPEGIILEGVIESMNEYYSKELAQKVKRGLNESRLKGNFTGGILPYGYKLDGKKIIIDEEKAEVVKTIFRLYSLGNSVESIINKLTISGILFKNKKFKHNTIYKMLKNERYTGIYRLNDQVFENMYPKIIEPDIYKKVQVKASAYQYGKQCTKSVYLFKNKLLCGYCNSPISSDTSRTRKNEKYDYYKCLGVKKYHNGCIKETFRKEVLEEFLINSIIEVLNQPKYINEITKHILEIQKNLNENNVILNNLINSKIKCEKSLNNIMEAVENGLMNNTTNKRMNELETEIENLERQIIIEKSKTNNLLTEQDIKQYYNKALKANSLELVNLIINKIILYNDKAVIIFNNPIDKSPEDIETQGFLFCKKIKYLYKEIQHYDIPIEFKTELDFYV